MPKEPRAVGRAGPPHLADVVVVIVVITGVAAVVRAVPGTRLVPGWLGAVAAGVFAGAVGVPLLSILREHGRGAVRWAIGVAALGGALPPTLLALSGSLALLLGHGPGAVVAAWSHGVSLLGYGPISWEAFGPLEWRSELIGLASGLIAWLLGITGRERPAGAWVFVALVLAATPALAWFIG